MATRRRLLSGSVAAGVLGLPGCTAFRSRDAELDGEWRQVGRDSTNTNHSPGVMLPGSLVERWRRRIGGQPYVPPVVIDGSVAASGAGRRGVTVARDGVAFRRSPRFFEDRQLLRLEGEKTAFHDHGSGVSALGVCSLSRANRARSWRSGWRSSNVGCARAGRGSSSREIQKPIYNT